jgi:hypothetical protein
MQVVGHDGVGEHIDAEDGGEFLDPLSNPFLSIGKIFSSDFIDPAEVSAPHAPLHHVQNRNFVGRKDFRTFGSRHKHSPQNRILPNPASLHNTCLAPSGGRARDRCLPPTKPFFTYSKPPHRLQETSLIKPSQIKKRVKEKIIYNLLSFTLYSFLASEFDKESLERCRIHVCSARSSKDAARI